MLVQLQPMPMSTSFIEKIYSHPNGSLFKLIEICTKSPSKAFYIELPIKSSIDGNRLVLNKIKNGLQVPLFKFKLDIFGVGFKAILENSILSLYLGRKPIEIPIPQGIKVEVKKNGVEIEISGEWLEDVSLFASRILNQKPAHKDKYKHKGISLSRIS